MQLPPDWGVASEHEGQTTVTGPKGENLYVGETYDNDFVEFILLSPFSYGLKFWSLDCLFPLPSKFLASKQLVNF